MVAKYTAVVQATTDQGGDLRVTVAFVETVEGELSTPDGYWRVQIVRTGRDVRWYRIWHAGTLVQDRASIATVRRILGDAFGTLGPAEPSAGENGVA